VNPRANQDEQLACFPQLQGVFQEIASGATDPTGLFLQEVAAAEQSGVPDAVSFELTVPEDILKGAKPTETGTVYSTAYVFFAACAGTVRLAAAPSAAGFPLECVGEDGTVLDAESFVAGYTQVYVFADGRTNQNPPVLGLTLDETVIEDGMDKAPTVKRCARPEGEEEPQGCSKKEPVECTTYKIEALVDDVAEVDVESASLDAPAVREAIWVDYYADAGKFSRAKKLVSDTVAGYRDDHEAEWTPPAEAGLVTLWAVVHDARGGASVTRRFVQVE
jgi:hypothetical protein